VEPNIPHLNEKQAFVPGQTARIVQRRTSAYGFRSNGIAIIKSIQSTTILTMGQIGKGGGSMRSLSGTLLLLAAVGLAALPGGAGGASNAPEFAGGGPWFNTDGPLILAGLRGKVVAVDMWTGGCINCINTLPYVKRWDARYRSQGLVIVGVHSLEFAHEHSVEYVKNAIAREGIRYPVVMDNDFKIWNAYKNVYWPALYLIDKKGAIRYTHVGESEYDTTERTIVKLLAEPG